METLQIDNLRVRIYHSKQLLGESAANDVAKKIVELQKEKNEINMIFAAAPSQDEFLRTLTVLDGPEWSRVSAFQLDEYIGLDNKKYHKSFKSFLKNKIFDKLNFKNVYYLGDNNLGLKDECKRYSQLIEAHPIDIACIGIGENGHIAFNDPHTADFNDGVLVKVVELDEKCRRQQVRDKCFNTLEQVPRKALTMTIPAIFSAIYIYCIVPGSFKAEAVRCVAKGDINESCPASILRRHANAIMYLDKHSAQFVIKET